VSQSPSYVSHVWMSHVTHVNETCYFAPYYFKYTWMSYVIHVNESCPFPPRHVTHMWMSHVTHVTDASDIHDMSQTCKWHDSHSWHVSDMSLASIWQMQVTFIWMQMTCLNESRHARHMHDVTHSHSLRQVTCIHIKLSSNYVKYTGMSSVIDVNESCPLPSPTSRTCEWFTPNEWVMSLIWMSHVSHMNESCHKIEWVIYDFPPPPPSLCATHDRIPPNPSYTLQRNTTHCNTL